MRSSRDSSSSTWLWLLMVLAWFSLALTSAADAQDEKGCEGVGYAKHSSLQYSPASLQSRLEQNPADVDALINLGIYLEEQDQFTKADALYARAVQAKPGCYLGFYFAGLLEDKIGAHATNDAEVKIDTALNLNPSLKTDPNIESFFRRRLPPTIGKQTSKIESTSTMNDLLASSRPFGVGVGGGFLLAVLVLHVVKRRVRQVSNHP